MYIYLHIVSDLYVEQARAEFLDGNIFQSSRSIKQLSKQIKIQYSYLLSTVPK